LHRQNTGDGFALDIISKMEYHHLNEYDSKALTGSSTFIPEAKREDGWWKSS
jgi:hypothetical protein